MTKDSDRTSEPKGEWPPGVALPEGHPTGKPWPVPWRDYRQDKENPAWREEVPHEPFNEGWAREDFGGAFVDALSEKQERFRGDWWLLAMLLRFHEWANKVDPKGEAPEREQCWERPYRSLVDDGWRAHLEHANLQLTHLEHANFSSANLEHATLEGAHLEHANLIEANLEHANLQGAHLEHAILHQAHLEHAILWYAHLEHANLIEANLEHANLWYAHLEHAILQLTHLEHANFSSANLEHAVLVHACLDNADVRGARGILFDQNPVDRLHIEGAAPDPWSKLRRKYTGPLYFVHLLLLIVFVLPYAARVLQLSAVDKVHDAIEQTLQNAADTNWPGSDSLRASLEAFKKTHAKRPAVWVLVGLLGRKHGEWFFALTMIIVLYNALRALLTYKVSLLRDAEERAKITPTLTDYYGVCYPLSKTPRWQDIPRVWRDELAKWWTTERRTEKWRSRWANRRQLSPLRVIGLYRLHQIASVFLGVAVLAFLYHLADWIWTTKLWLPIGS